MSSALVIYEPYSEEIVVCTLNRPEKRNALSSLLLQNLLACIERAGNDSNVRIFILRANGPVFSAGLDFRETLNSELGSSSAAVLKQCLLGLYQMPAVTIAAVRGAAMGGGAGLVAACDFAVAASGATIGFPEVRLGLIPAQVMSLLIRKLKQADIRQLLVSGESVDAEHAMRMGLFHRVGNVDAIVREMISQLLKAAPGALAATKRLIEQLYSRDLQADIEMCLKTYLEIKRREEAQEGVRAFLEKRKPNWEKSWPLSEL
jgi:methylglutaconyl-CoA hydratase